MIDAPPAILCAAPRAIDGDTIACANLTAHVRLIGIDAPEMPGHCRRGRICTPGNPVASQRALAALLAAGPVLVHPAGYDRYARILGRVTVTATLGTVDASCRMIATGTAVARYAPIAC